MRKLSVASVARGFTAGRLSGSLVDAELRYLRCGDTELVRRISIAVRDPRWGTLSPSIKKLDAETDGRRVIAEIEARCEGEGIELDWRTKILAEDRRLEWEVVLTPTATFEYNRLGLVILHPIRESIGRRFRASLEGVGRTGRLPELVGPQLLSDGLPQPLFDSFDQLDIEGPDGVWLRFEFEGDSFEMEDQRNWADGSFKTYSTPLSLGFPHRAAAGVPIIQRMRLEVGSDGPGATRRGARPRDRAAVTIDTRQPIGVVPEIGVSLSPVSGRDNAALARIITSIPFSHVQVEIGAHAGPSALLAVAAEAGIPVELALGSSSHERAASLLAESGATLCRILVPVSDVCRPGYAAGYRPGLPVPLIAAAEDHFAELNRDPPDMASWDGIACSVTPQVHQFDDATLRESLESLESLGLSATRLARGKSVHVTPMTLRPRRGPGSEPRNGAPAGTDPRQSSAFAAAWTLGAIAALGAGGVSSVTAYEATGPRGIFDEAGGKYPVAEVIAALAELAGQRLYGTRVDRPLTVSALVADGPRGKECHVANLTAAAVEVRVDGESMRLAPHGRIRL